MNRARVVQVEYQYGPFRGFDMHEDGQTRMVEMKKQIDGPIAQLIRDLADRGLLERTLVVVATEFGRTIANQPKAGVEPIGFAEAQSGDQLTIEDKKMYGFHGHFSAAPTACCSLAAASSRGSSMVRRPTGIRCCRSKTR